MQKKIQLPKDESIGPEAVERHDATADDVEGHRAMTKNPLTTGTPSAGGEASPRLPSTGGELTDDAGSGGEGVIKR